ncbi:MAG: 3'-5' exonuclease [Patescibacteria group bacterium]
MSEKQSTRIKERPLIFVDLEFTGLQWKHEVIQIGCLVVGQPDFKIIKEWETKINAEHWDQADPEALKIVGYTEERWKDAVALREALTAFNETARDGVLVGFNVAMDFLYLKKAYASVDMEPTFHWQIIDVLSMAFKDLYALPLTEYRMSELTTHFKIKNDIHHDALEDARMTYELFLKLCRTS